MQLTEPAGAELQAINQFVLTVPQSWSTPTTQIAGELSRNRPPYGPSVDMFKETLDVERVTILAGQDHLALVTAPQELAHAINEAVRRDGDRYLIPTHHADGLLGRSEVPLARQ